MPDPAYLQKEVALIRLQPTDVLDEVKRRKDLLLRLQNQRRVRVPAGNLEEYKLLDLESNQEILS